MKKVFYIVFFINFTMFSFLANAKEKAVDVCLRNMRNPEVVITTSYGNLKYDHSKNRRSITRMHIEKYKGKLQSSSLLNGLSTFEYAVNVKFRLVKQTLLSGTTCIYPSSVQLHIGVGEDPVIYIARDYPENSCMYNVVLRHEQTHQQIYQSVLEYYLPIIKERLLKAVSENAITVTDDDINMEVAKQELRDKYLSVINPLLEEIKRETSVEQLKLDNSKNYEYENKLCQ